ncbi:hypothetical protein GCM10010965_25920 [Caldalkalibacillus thermarum]|uniref:CHY zinc finger protein n=1 Tax=Caldalkalibacillus thermarum TaxID=296745 RepID=UPI001662E040|nr:CHY zinc finger protein [Caldalkalibacillus thermarum]GGK31863.1 hypothetical protein GCM10010965_25920 [Caldalkalibacillus thermarum]
MRRKIGKVWVYGEELDQHSRCRHYRTGRDIVAIKFPCCQQYWACYDCHTALSGHQAARWPQAKWDTTAILCGACGRELSIKDYLGCQFHCPACEAPFNPHCARHYHLYFEQ